MKVEAPSWRVPAGITSHIGPPLGEYVNRVANAVSPWWLTLTPQPDSNALYQRAVWLPAGAAVPFTARSSMRKEVMSETSEVERNCRRTVRLPNAETS